MRWGFGRSGLVRLRSDGTTETLGADELDDWEEAIGLEELDSLGTSCLKSLVERLGVPCSALRYRSACHVPNILLHCCMTLQGPSQIETLGVR